MDVNDMQPSACQNNFNHNNNKKKMSSCPRCLVCALWHYGSDDPDKCPSRGYDFSPDWINMIIIKHNVDHVYSLKKEQAFLPPPPMEPTITKSKFQANEANVSFAEDSNM